MVNRKSLVVSSIVLDPPATVCICGGPACCCILILVKGDAAQVEVIGHRGMIPPRLHGQVYICMRIYVLIIPVFYRACTVTKFLSRIILAGKVSIATGSGIIQNRCHRIYCSW